MHDERIYQIVDLFMAGIAANEIASTMKITTLEVMEILQGDTARAYMDKVRELRRMELDALGDGPALDAAREAINVGSTKERLTAADMVFKAAGKYKETSSTVATLAEVLKRVMDDADEKKDVSENK